MSDELLTADQVAAMCGVRVQTVYRWVASGRISYIRVGRGPAGRLRFRPQAVRDVMPEIDREPGAR